MQSELSTIVVYAIVIIGLIIYAWYVKKEIKKYEKTAYYHMTRNSWMELYFNKGKRGEYEIYKYLEVFEEHGAVYLFNLYIPRPGEKTTELDVVMIFRKGIVVIESKNYSGWIFGDENSKMWMQTLIDNNGKSHKVQFYNPILQNQGHINNLKTLLNEEIPIYSLIVFSERCTLKKVPENSRYTKIINRFNIRAAVQKICEENPDVLDSKQIHDIYKSLFKYTQVNEKTKQEHIQNIRK